MTRNSFASNPRPRFATRFSTWLLTGTALISTACTEEGHSPDCPGENYINDDGTVDQAEFDTWREAMVKAGCLTDVGGTWKNGGAGGQGGSSSR